MFKININKVQMNQILKNSFNAMQNFKIKVFKKLKLSK